jgi:hypothetical protein
VERLLWLALATATVLMCPRSAIAQQGCSPGGTTLNSASGINSFTLTADLTKGNCNGVLTEAHTDIGGPDFCLDGSTLNQSFGSCEDTTFVDGAGQARATYRKFACGPITGFGDYGKNYGSMPQTTFEVMAGRVRNFDVTCPAPPPDEYCTYEWNNEYETWQCMSPIIIATGNNQNYRLTSAEDGVLFDMNGDGVLTRMGWTRAHDDIAFLVWDRDGDGVIPGVLTGKDLLGNFTMPGAVNGFMALYDLQVSQTGVWQDRLTADDELFGRLYLWTDRDHDALVDAGEIRRFGDQFSAILFASTPHHRRDGHNNRYAWRGTVLTRTGPGKNPTKGSKDSKERQRNVYDVFLTGIQ